MENKLSHELEATTASVLKEVLKETKSLVRWRLLSKVFWIVLIVTFFGFILVNSTENTAEDKMTPHIAVISLQGIITENTESSVDKLVPLLKSAFENPHAKAVFIDANSPGGSPVQSAIIHDSINRLKTQYAKTVVAVVSDLCASGCYYAIAGVDKIVAHQSSIIGSIGVRLESFDFRGLMGHIGVKQRLLTAGKNKALINPFGELEPETRKHLQQMIDQTHEEFIRIVKRGRGTKLDKSSTDLFSGLVWMGAESIDLGLVDELGDLFTEAENYEFDHLVRYEREKTFVEKMFEVVEAFSLPTSHYSIQAKY